MFSIRMSHFIELDRDIEGPSMINVVPVDVVCDFKTNETTGSASSIGKK